VLLQLEKMPIKAGFCDNWYAACADDKFCAADDGDFFSCAAIYKVCVCVCVNYMTNDGDLFSCEATYKVCVRVCLCQCLCLCIFELYD
jgi:hypothetical protein